MIFLDKNARYLRTYCNTQKFSDTLPCYSKTPCNLVATSGAAQLKWRLNYLLQTKPTGAGVNMAQKPKSFDIVEPDNKINLLLLGPAKSGKSTLIKQMQYFSGSSPSTEERKKYTKDIIKSIFVTLQKIIRSMEQLQIGKYNICK